MSKIKVLHYIPGFNIGGIESRLIDWYRNMDKEKVQFIVVKLNDIESEKIKEFGSLGGRYYSLPHLNFKNLKFYIKGLKKIFKDEKPDVVHVHSLDSGAFVIILARIFGVKVRILHSRTTDYLPNEKNVLIKNILRLLAPKFATDYFACSEKAGIWAFGKKKINKVKIIKNGIDLPKFYFDEKIRKNMRKKLNLDENIIIGSISRLSPQKNMMFLLNIFLEVYRKNKNYRLLIVGDGPLFENIKSKISSLGLDKVVILVGAHSDVWNYYMSFDVFLSTSFYEGFGTTAIEAQATGVPTILSDGFPKVVEVTNYVKRLSLKDDTNIWAQEILNTRERLRSSKDAKEIEKAGYSAKNVAFDLQKFYSKDL